MKDVDDRHIDTDVTVQLSCSGEDARAVFEALDRVYAIDDPPTAERVPQVPAPTVWMATFDTAASRGAAARPMHLSSEVPVLLTGGYHAVDEIEKVLAQSFDVRSLESVSGDQETEARLLLASR
ncbi:hypothetical protein ACGFMM_15945 [Streptomyces sp. NPDC048604]|uniref:hypothetical protein n=1 Tax=Streptomyces sp. NPDC048604 TaxID=3365578 RepID=UPI00371F8862